MFAKNESTKNVKAWWLTLALFLAGGVSAGCTVDFAGPGSDCGDGLIQGDETCDDGNSVSGDGCGGSCQVEDGWTCAGEPSVCETECGDGVARGTEACDGADVRSLTCAQLGLGAGVLACAPGCVFDTSGCELQAVCGNDAREYPEDCDGDDLAGQTCADLGFEAGDLACTPGCAFDTLACVHLAQCGDGVAEDPEDCDGEDLAGTTCEGLGLGSGTLRCSAGCDYDVSDCSGSATCGNATIEFPEKCDGLSLGGEDCLDQGYYGGTLACRQDCTGFDLSGCSGQCGDGVVNGPEVCDGADLDGSDCTDHGYYVGTLGCAPSCLSFDTSGCSGECGDGVTNGSEDCDDADLDGTNCVDLGHYGGALACRSTCTFDETGCHLVPKVVINEITHGWPDTVELVNLSVVEVNLQGWTLDTHGIDQNGNPILVPLDIPYFLLDAGQRVLLRDQTNGNGTPPTVDIGSATIQYHDNVFWGGGLSPGSAILSNNGGVVLDFARWGDMTFGPPPGTTWADTPGLLLGQAGDGISLSRVPDGVDTDTAADFCVTLATDGLANGACLDPGAGTTVLISEIDIGSPDRVELYNAGPLALDLRGWTLYFYDDNGPELGGTSLPSYVLDVGDYVELRDNPTPTPPYVSGDVIYVNNMAWTPPDPGGCGLVDPAGTGRDFVRWSNSSAMPWAPDQFTDQPSAAPTPTNSFSLGRMSHNDTDTAGDWCLQPMSIGSSNGVCI